MRPAVLDNSLVIGGLCRSSYSNCGVSVSGGQTRETKMPQSLISLRRASEKPLTANFDQE
jgi:hypothetical protein